jgi:hypothetical protein
MIKKLFFLFSFVIVLLLTSCIPTLTLSEVSNLRKNMSPVEASEVASVKPDFEFTFPNPDNSDSNILVHTHKLSSGTYKSDYLFMFIDEELYFWGYPHEFSRSTDSLINLIGKLTVKELEKKKS